MLRQHAEQESVTKHLTALNVKKQDATKAYKVDEQARQSVSSQSPPNHRTAPAHNNVSSYNSFQTIRNSPFLN